MRLMYWDTGSLFNRNTGAILDKGALNALMTGFATGTDPSSSTCFSTPAKPEVWFTLPSQNSLQTCIFNLTGKTDSIASAVKIEGAFQGDSVLAVLNTSDTSWQTGVSYPVNFSGNDTIVVTGTFAHNFISRDTLIVNIKCDPVISPPNTIPVPLIIPNLISPNADGRNDFFAITDSSVMQLEIYNLWGEKIFESGNYKNDWAGESGKEGIYYFHLQSMNGEKQKGWVQVIR